MISKTRPTPALLGWSPLLLGVLLLGGCATLPTRPASSTTTTAPQQVPAIPLPPRPGIHLVTENRLTSQANPSGSIPFPGRSVALPPAAAEAVGRIADELATHGQASVILAGFASDRLGRAPARTLSEARALAVRYALAEAGIHPARLHTSGFGSDLPAPAGEADQVWWGILR